MACYDRSLQACSARPANGNPEGSGGTMRCILNLILVLLVLNFLSTLLGGGDGADACGGDPC